VAEVSKTAEWLSFERAIGGKGINDRAAVQTQGTAKRSRKVRSSEVEMRRGIVAGNLTKGPKELCVLFDQAGLPLPKGRKPWAAYVQNWRQAEKSDLYRENVRQIISKDKDKVQKTTVKP
jgi:hypothetical protein